MFFFFFFFNDTATTEIYTLSLHDALPISVPAPSTSTISSSEAIWDTPRPCTAASAVSRSAASTTTIAGSTAISGASADLNTATSSAITKAMENHWTRPPVLPEVALVSARVATVPAVCTENPGGG